MGLLSEDVSIPQASALVGVAASIDEYANSIVLDAYCEQRQFEREVHI